MEEVQHKARVMVWAGAEGLKELSWSTWRRDSFEGRTPKVTSNTYREVIKKTVGR